MKRNLLLSGLRCCWLQTVPMTLVLCAVSSWASAQTTLELDDACIVSVLNRTARVPADGNWVLQDIPFVSSQVRARFSCPREGETLRGISDLDSFAPDADNAFPADVVLIGSTSIPSALTLSAPVEFLTLAAPTTQLQATAEFADGATSDVTFAGSGIRYSTSNPDVAVVDSDGGVSAVGSGTVLVTARLDGALALTRLQVALSGDSDGDGIADDLELALGLNPNDPGDALEDPDGDGLTNVAEVGLGTDIRRADTDGDTIADGEETIAGSDGFITNPLLRDSDGDFIPDGTETATGTDPTNAGSGDLASVLTGIQVLPSQNTLTVNTVIGQASQQLRIEGQLVDGLTTDLTLIGSGTTYISDDLLVCNFGAVDGEIFAGNDGSCVVTVINNGFDGQASFNVSTFAPVPLASVPSPIPRLFTGIAADGVYVYAMHNQGIQIWDISIPMLPSIRGELFVGLPRDIGVLPGGFLLLQTSFDDDPLQLVDVGDPDAPTFIGGVDIGGDRPNFIAVEDGLAFVTLSGFNNGLAILDVSNPASPVLLSLIPITFDDSLNGFNATVGSVKASGRTVYVHEKPRVQFPDRIVVIDVSEPTEPVIVSRADFPFQPGNNFAVDERALYVANGIRLDVIDTSDPLALTVVGTFQDDVLNPGKPTPAGEFLFFSNSNFTTRLHEARLIGVSDPTNPTLRDAVSFTSITGFTETFFGSGFAVTAEQFFMPVQSQSFNATSSRLSVGQFLILDDNNGVAPTVEIESLGPVAVATESSDFTFSVAAEDDVAVLSVQALIDGIPVARDLFPPFTFRVPVPNGVDSFRVGARAFDPAGNAGTAEEVRVIVEPALP